MANRNFNHQTNRSRYKNFILLVLSIFSISALPLNLDKKGEIVSADKSREIMLGEPYWFWEGGSSRVDIEQKYKELSILFHIDVANTNYWVDLTIYQTTDGIDIVGSHSSGIWPDICESYKNWNDVLKNQDQPLAQIAVDCLRRCGMTEKFQTFN